MPPYFFFAKLCFHVQKQSTYPAEHVNCLPGTRPLLIVRFRFSSIITYFCMPTRTGHTKTHLKRHVNKMHNSLVTAKLDEDDPAKLSLMEKMKMFNSRLTHKPPVAGLPKPKEERSRGTRLRTMPVLASQVQEAMENNERLTKSFTHDDVPLNPNFQMKMELFRSASAKNTSLEYIMRQNKKFRSLGLVFLFLSLVMFIWLENLSLARTNPDWFSKVV